MMKNGMDKMGLSVHKFVKPSSKCKNKLCGKMLKNKKKYTLTEVIVINDGFWTIGKQCKYCKMVSVSDKSD